MYPDPPGGKSLSAGGTQGIRLSCPIGFQQSREKVFAVKVATGALTDIRRFLDLGTGPKPLHLVGTDTSVRIMSYLSFLPFCTTQATVFLSSMSNPIYFSIMAPPEKGFVALRTATFIWDVSITIPCQPREAPVS